MQWPEHTSTDTNGGEHRCNVRTEQQLDRVTEGALLLLRAAGGAAGAGGLAPDVRGVCAALPSAGRRQLLPPGPHPLLLLLDTQPV